MKEKFNAILEKLGLKSKAAASKLTKADLAKIEEQCQTDFGKSMADVLAAIATEETADDEPDATVLSKIASITASTDGGEDDGAGEGKEAKKPTATTSTPEAVLKQVQTVVDDNKELRAKLTKIEKEMDKTDPKAATAGTAKRVISLCGPGTTATHLFGIPDPLFEMSKPWNKLAHVGAPVLQRNDYAGLEAEFSAYATSVQERMEYLHKNKMNGALMTGNLDYTALESEFGAEYRVRRMDAIITFIKRLPSITKYFPIRYGVQDKQDMVQSFSGKSFTQARQAGRVFAGSHKFQPIQASVKAVMFKFQFADLWELETEYIGYLNKEGSDPMKWNFIEWIMIENSKIQHNEKEKRRVKGYRIEPTVGAAGHFMYASDGILTNIEKGYEHHNAVYVFTDKRAYSSSTILAYIEAFAEAVYQMKDDFSDMVLCMNEKHAPWYTAAYRAKYGTDMDFAGSKVEIMDYNVSPERIFRIPNMGNRYDMWFMPKDSIEILEDKPGEFFNYYMERTLEELLVAAYGKEGTFTFYGQLYATRVALLADNGLYTNIFRNNPTTLLTDGATTCNGALNEMFETIQNSAPTAITDITNAVQGVAYKILCGHVTNATTIAQAGKFSTITAGYTPTAVGDYIKVVYDSANSKFYEIERKVNGVLAINTALTAPDLDA
jgi:hypothetical protein